MDNLKELAALTALNNMMTKGWFDICTINSVAELLGVNPKCEAYMILYPLHCIHFDKMPDELKEAIPKLVQQCLGAAPIFQFGMLRQNAVVEVMSEHRVEKRGWLQVLRKR